MLAKYELIEAMNQENRFDINEVAVTVGFNDANYFSRVFKKYKMMTPSEFRQRQIAVVIK